jgi:hypothetical protein
MQKLKNMQQAHSEQAAKNGNREIRQNACGRKPKAVNMRQQMPWRQAELLAIMLYLTWIPGKL